MTAVSFGKECSPPAWTATFSCWLPFHLPVSLLESKALRTQLQPTFTPLPDEESFSSFQC